jgi:cytochrome P450
MMNPPDVRGLGRLPLLGHALPLLRDPLGLLRTAYKQAGPVFALHAPGRDLVVLAGADANRFAQKEGKNLLISGPFWNRLLIREHQAAHQIVAVDGPEHQAQRRLYGDVLSRKAVKEHQRTCDARIRETLASALGGAPVEINATTRLLVTRLVHHVTTGAAEAVEEPVARAMTETFRWQSNALLLGKWPSATLQLPAYKRSRQVWDRFLTDLTAREIDGDTPATDGWFARIRIGRQQHPESFGAADTRTAAALPFIAGVDTVGATLGFALYELHRRPELHAHVRAEVDECYTAAGGSPDVTALRACPNLSGLIHECLRLYPAAFAMYRTAAHDFDFAGCRIRRGQDVLVYTTADHFDAKQFPSPMRLDVGRLERGEYKGRAFAPYGAGPHICLGASMGDALLHTTVASIVHHFQIHLVDAERPPQIVYDPSLTISHRHRMQVTSAQTHDACCEAIVG